MATHRIEPDSPERIRLIAEALGIPADSPLTDWRLEGVGGEYALLTVTLARTVDIETANRVLNAPAVPADTTGEQQ